MRTTWLLTALAAATAVDPPAAPLHPGGGGPQEEAPEGDARLRRVGSEREAPRHAPTPFDEVYWTALLSDTDLEAREDAFERLVERAREDGEFEAWLDRLAGSDENLTLAWTARLALREVACAEGRPRRERAPVFLRTPSLMVGSDLTEELGDLERRLQRIFGSMGVQVIAPGRPSALGAPGAAPKEGTAGRQRVHVEKGPGGVKLRVETSVDGESSLREYEGRTLEDVLRKHPELEQQLGLRIFEGFGGRSPWSFRIPRGRLRADASVHAREVAVEQDDVLGVHLAPLPPERAAVLELQDGIGLAVTGVVPGTIAWALGLDPGDVLRTVGGRAIRSLDDVTAALRARGPGESLTVTWVDARGRPREKTWRPLERAGPADAGARSSDESGPPSDG